MRILLLSQWFDPEPTLKGLDFARELTAHGHEVHVITGFPNYPGGKLYQGYRVRLFQREVIGSILVWRVPLFPSHDGSAVGRAANYLSFMLSALIAGLLAPRAAVIYAYHPPLTVGVAARLIGKMRRIPVLYDIQDLWPDTLAATGMIRSPVILRWLDRLSRWTYRGMDRIAVLSEGFRQALIARDIDAQRIVWIPNWAPPSRWHEKRGGEDAVPVKLLFAGNMGKAQGLDSLLDAMELVRAQGPLAELTFIGGGTERAALLESASRRQMDYVTFLPAVSTEAVQDYLADADVLVVHLTRDRLFEITIPSKTQAYLAAGRPILMAVRGDAAALVTDAKAGICAEPDDPQSIAEAIMAFVRMSATERSEMGVRGRRFYEEQLSFAVGVRQFLRELEVLGR